MEKITYFAQVVNENHIEVSQCHELPDFIHAVKFDYRHQLEVIFDVNSNWTSELEKQVMNGLASPIAG